MRDHAVIWLQPWCDQCARHDHSDTGRTWCADNIYDDCEDCGAKAVRYVLPAAERERCAKIADKFETKTGFVISARSGGETCEYLWMGGVTIWLCGGGSNDIGVSAMFTQATEGDERADFGEATDGIERAICGQTPDERERVVPG